MIANLTPNSVRADFVHSAKWFTSPNVPYISLPVPETFNRHKMIVSVMSNAITPRLRAYIKFSRGGMEVLRFPYQIGVQGTKPNIRPCRTPLPNGGSGSTADFSEGFFVKHPTLGIGGCAVHYFCGNIDKAEFIVETIGTNDWMVCLGVFSDNYL
jgi:hypothetical protein